MNEYDTLIEACQSALIAYRRAELHVNTLRADVIQAEAERVKAGTSLDDAKQALLDAVGRPVETGFKA